MNITRAIVIAWLDEYHHDREFLAAACGVGTAAVSNWLREIKPRPIPGKAVVIIHGLIQKDEEEKMARERIPQNLVLEFSPKEFDVIEQVALAASMTVREWSREKLEEIAHLQIEECAEGLKRRMG
jgi:hypothetical protein